MFVSFLILFETFAKQQKKKKSKINGFYHEYVKPKKLQDLSLKRKNSTITYTWYEYNV